MRVWSELLKRITRRERRTPGIRRVLVTGGGGFVGSALLPLLLEQGYTVRVLDLFLYGKEPLGPWLNDPRVEILQSDFRQVDCVAGALRDVDAVIHLGAIVGDPACDLDKDLTAEINLAATRMIAETAKAHGVRLFVFTSTCAIYGASDSALNERSALKPISLYARSKAAAEKILLAMADGDFAPVIVRFSTMYGLSGRYRFDLVVNLLTAKALIDGEITVFGGNQWRAFVHVEDAARSILHVLAAPRETVRGQIFNVGSDEQNYTIAQVGEMIQTIIPAARILIQGDQIDPNNYRVSFRKIRTALGFLPHWTLEAGIQQVRESLLGGRIADYKSPEYSNVKFLTHKGLPRLDRPEDGWASRLMEAFDGGNKSQVE